MNAHPLKAEDRIRVLNAIKDALASAEAAVPPLAPGNVERNLDMLVEIVRHSTAQRIEPYLAQILDEICSKCPQSQPSMFCPLRYERNCILFRNARPILKAIASVLEEIHDPEYEAQRATLL